MSLVTAWCVAALSITLLPPAYAQNFGEELDAYNDKIRSSVQKGDLDSALSLAGKYVERSKELRGEDNETYGGAQSWLGYIHFMRGEYDKSEPAYLRALAISEKLHGSEHPDVGSKLNNLAGLYQEQGRYDEAEKLLKRSIEIAEKSDGATDKVIVVRINNLGQLYVEQGRFVEAEPLLQRSLEVTKEVYGSEHRKVSIRLHNLGELYRELGRYNEAEPLFKKALEIVESLDGPEHVAVSATLGKLGKLRTEMARYKEAEADFQKALKIRQQAYGPENVRTAGSLNDLAAFYLITDRINEAEEYAKKALSIRESALGAAHPKVAVSRYIIAGINEQQGMLSEAEELYKSALKIQEKALRSDHPDLARTQASLGGLYASIGRSESLDDAQALLEKALAAREKVLGEGHPDTVSTMLQLAELYRLQGRNEEAEQLFKRAREIRKSGLTEIRVYYATNRRRTPNTKVLSYGTDRDEASHLGEALVAIVQEQAPRRWSLRRSITEDQLEVSVEATDVRRLAIVKLSEWSEVKSMDMIGREAVRATAYPKQALVFVHGYNVSFDNSVRRAAQIAYDVGFDGPVLVFSWPSRQSYFGYLTDRDSVDISTQHLKDYLENMLAKSGIVKTHFVAHSMGNMLLMRALSQTQIVDKEQAFQFGEIVNAAPDVDFDLYKQFAKKIKSQNAKMTVYASARDWALWWSQALRGFTSRIGYIAGEKPKLVPGVDLIDISGASLSVFSTNHNVYARSPVIVADIRRLLRGQRPPNERTKEFEAVPLETDGIYYRYRGVK